MNEEKEKEKAISSEDEEIEKLNQDKEEQVAQAEEDIKQAELNNLEKDEKNRILKRAKESKLSQNLKILDTLKNMRYPEITLDLATAKHKADLLLKNSEYDSALKEYKDLLEKVETIIEENTVLKKVERDDIKLNHYIPILANLSYIHIKEYNWESVIKYSERILKMDEKNIKALYRKVTALTYKGDFSDAEKNMEKLKEILPSCTELESLKVLLQRRQNEAKINDIKYCRNMMRGVKKVNNEEEYKRKNCCGKLFYNMRYFFWRAMCCCHKKRKNH